MRRARDESAGSGEDAGERQSKGGILTRRLKLVLIGIAALVVAGSPFWAPLLMRRMAFFHVHRIEILGAHYVAPSDILTRLHVDTSASVWDATAPLVARVVSHPEIESAVIHRKLPGTLVIEIRERVPVALVPGNGGFRVFDARGTQLPIDPARVRVDAPVLLQRDTAVLRLLGTMRRDLPALYNRVSAIQQVGSDELLIQLPTGPVRAMHDVTLDRLADIEPVEQDLARKQLRVAEIDLRYRDQVIARLQ